MRPETRDNVVELFCQSASTRVDNADSGSFHLDLQIFEQLAQQFLPRPVNLLKQHPARVGRIIPTFNGRMFRRREKSVGDSKKIGFGSDSLNSTNTGGILIVIRDLAVLERFCSRLLH